MLQLSQNLDSSKNTSTNIGETQSFQSNNTQLKTSQNILQKVLINPQKTKAIQLSIITDFIAQQQVISEKHNLNMNRTYSNNNNIDNLEFDPDIQKLQQMQEYQLERVHNFTVRCPSTEIMFLEPLNLNGVNFEHVFTYDNGGIQVNVQLFPQFDRPIQVKMEVPNSFKLDDALKYCRNHEYQFILLQPNDNNYNDTNQDNNKYQTTNNVLIFRVDKISS